MTPGAPDAAGPGGGPAIALVALLWGCVTPSAQQTVTLDSGSPDVSPVLQQPQGRFLKRKVAIARFTNETRYGKSVFLDQDGDTIGKQASDILAARLQATGKFLLLERRDAEKVEREAERFGGESLSIPADYLILGSVSEFGRSTTGEKGVLSKTKKQRAWAKVNLRLVDVRTGVTIHSDEGAGEATHEVGTVFGVGTTAGYDATLDEKALSAAISRVVSNVAANLLEQPWRSYVLRVDGDRVVIGGGAEQGLQVGDRFGVLARGERVTNPQTGATLELPGAEVARIEVVSMFGSSSEDEGAICRVVSGSLTDLPLEQLVVVEVE